MVSKRKTKKSVKKRIVRRKSSASKNNSTIIYGAIAALVVAVIVFAFQTGNQKNVGQSQPVKVEQKKVQEVKDNKVSDIKKTKEAKPLNIPKKTKAINAPTFNEKAIQIRFAEIDWNSNKKISLKEYLYYFKDKAVGKKKFQSIDKNKDKSITYDEYLASKK